MIPRSELKATRQPYEVDDANYERFPVPKQAFVTVSFQDTGKFGYLFFLEKMHQNMVRRMLQGEEGFSQEETARDLGANAFNLLIGQYGFPNFQLLQWKPFFVLEMMQKHPVAFTPEAGAARVKETARLYGADLVGVAELDDRWIYSQDLVKPFVRTLEGIPEETQEAFHIPRSIHRAVVMAFAMDDDLIETSPKVPASVTVSVGYSRMGIAAVSLAEYIRGLGYQAIPCMNDTALSVPLAVDAGLGQLGRLGILITPEYGPNVRLAKVLTDMPLEVDHPIDFGVVEFCKNCYLCADHCPSGAISYEEPSFEPACDNNNPGVKKWPILSEKCLKFWQINGASCANCIAICPFTKGFESMQCFECDKCETQTGCELQVNTYLRLKYGLLESNVWGNVPKVLKPRRSGL